MSGISHDVRLARPSEVAAIAALVDAAYGGYVERMGREPAPMLADYGDLVARGVVFVLSAGEEVQGVLVLIPGDDSMLLENIAVHPARQGRGLGRALMAFAEEQARAAGLAEVRLYTNELMTENLAFYRRLGYEETARKTVDGYRRVFMRKRLQESEVTSEDSRNVDGI